MEPLKSTMPDTWKKRSRYARAILILAFLSAATYFSFIVLFPSRSFLFDFKNPQASKNTLLDPHDSDGAFLGKGNIPEQKTLIMDAPIEKGDYSLMDISFTPDKKSQASQGMAVIRKSYRAFFLPEGDPVSQPAAYTGKFHSGSLVSFADGVFLIDGDLIRPIGDAVIFENLGYDWSDVVPGSEEEMGLYTKGKMVVMGNKHPDGTVFLDTDTGIYFLVQNNEKHRITDRSTAESYLQGTHPILVSGKALAIEQSCTLLKSGFLNSYFECSTGIDSLKNLPGDSYRIAATFDQSASLQDAQVVFSDTLSKENMLFSLSKIKQRIFSHYGYGQ